MIVIGVDLGTTFSVVAVDRRDLGIVIVPDEDGIKPVTYLYHLVAHFLFGTM